MAVVDWSNRLPLVISVQAEIYGRRGSGLTVGHALVFRLCSCPTDIVRTQSQLTAYRQIPAYLSVDMGHTAHNRENSLSLIVPRYA